MRAKEITRCKCGNIARLKGLCFGCYQKQYRQEHPDRYQKYQERRREQRRVANAIKAFLTNMSGRIYEKSPRHKTWTEQRMPVLAVPLTYTCSKSSHLTEPAKQPSARLISHGSINSM